MAVDLDQLRADLVACGGLLTKTGVARLVGDISHQRISPQRMAVVIADEHLHFPRPAVLVGTTAFYFRVEVEAWLPTWTSRGATGGAGMHRRERPADG